jgi:hypothetical protein
MMHHPKSQDNTALSSQNHEGMHPDDAIALHAWILAKQKNENQVSIP